MIRSIASHKCHRHLTLRHIAALMLAILLLASCSRPTYHIGFSQCYHNEWNDRMATDLQREAMAHPELKLTTRYSYTGTKGQLEDILKLIDMDVDLLIIAPEEAEAFNSAIELAHQRSIPVILLDSETDSRLYTAIVQTDNTDVGYRVGQFLVEQLKGKGNIISLRGVPDATTTYQRHEGFAKMLAANPGIHIIDSCYTDWTYQCAFPLIDSLLSIHSDVDAIAAQNDPLALAAYDACKRHGLSPMPIILGVDALTGAGNGMQNVAEGKITVSFTNPTGGSEAIQLALDILKGRPYQRVTYLSTQRVDKDNVQLLISQEQRIERLNQLLDDVSGRLGSYFQQTNTLQLIIVAAVLLIILITAFTVYVIVTALQRQRLQKNIDRIAEAKLSFFTNVSHSFRTPLTLIADPVRTLLEEGELNERQQELLQLMQSQTDELQQLVDKVLGVLQDDMLQSGTQLDAIASQTLQTPASAAVFRQRRVSLEPQVSAQENRSTILIIDDNARLRRYLTLILTRRKYLVLTAPNGEEGLLIAQQNVPDLIISDVMMPVMDGLECCRLLKSSPTTSHIPVLLLTAYGLDDQRIQGYQSGADAYITKPFVAKVLCARIDNLIQNRRQINPVNDRYKEIERHNLSDVDSNYVNHFHSFVTEHLSDPDLDIQQLCNEFHMSRVQVYRKCKSLTSYSPTELIRIIRLKAATQMLETTDKTISEIAYDCGFSTPSYFAKCYRDQYQRSPTDVQRSKR